MMRIDDSSSEEEDVPLPQSRDMHVEFKKSSLPDRVEKPKFEFIPFDSCRKIIRAYAKRY